MELYLQYFILLPLVAFIVSLLIPARDEKLFANLASILGLVYIIGLLAFCSIWIMNGANLLDSRHLTIYRSDSFEFYIDFLFDKTSAVFGFTGGLVFFLVTKFSRYYLHRDPGFKRFFSTVFLFFLGYNLVVFSGNFETLFTGWEILGFCSFLLIGYYRDRYLPVKNALKVISIYRFGDVCLMLAMWMCHHLFHENISFLKLTDTAFINSLMVSEPGMFLFIAAMIFLSAAAKSAAFPFSSWLPRAMEGPTSSSAIFYGALSVHLGIFLLIRTYTIWEPVMLMKIIIIAVGIITCLVANSIASVQATVKTQIAYASISQIGLMFIEVALGLHTLALIHFAGNAFLRTYQLLISPSVLNYKLHDMFFHFKSGNRSNTSSFYKAIYLLNIKEWNLDKFQYKVLWSPFKWIGRNANLLLHKTSYAIIGIIFLLGLYSFAVKESIPEQYINILPIIASGISFLLIMTSFADRGSALRSWMVLVMAQCFLTLSIALNSHIPFHQVAFYLSGVLAGGIGGFACLKQAAGLDGDIKLDKFHGYHHKIPMTGFLFLVSLLALIGFPITTTFLGIDLLFTHIHKTEPMLLILTALSFIFIEIVALRIYSRIFLGPYKKNTHPIAYRSS